TCIPIVAGTPRAAAKGSGANADTAGHPSPPNASSHSDNPGNPTSPPTAPPGPTAAGAGPHQATATPALPTPARRSAVSASATQASTPAGSRSSTPEPGGVAVTVMGLSNQVPPTVGRVINRGYPAFRDIHRNNSETYSKSFRQYPNEHPKPG